MGHNNAHPSTYHIAAVSVWCIVWLAALMFGQHWLAALVILVGGPMLAWLLNRYRASRHFN
jgi:Flp pilus assembly protein TadB